MKIALLLAVLSLANLAHAGADVTARQPGLEPAVVNVWAACAKNFFSQPLSEAYANQLGGIIASLNSLDLRNDEVISSLRPLATEVRANAEKLLIPQIPGGADPQLAAKTLKLRALAETPLASFIDSTQQWRAEAMYRSYQDRLSVQERDQVAERMRPIAAGLLATSKTGPAPVDATSFDPELHKNGLQPSAVAKIAQAQAYFKESGIPVKSIRYHEGYWSSGMSPYDGDSWTPESLTVAFADGDGYRRWKDSLPHKIGGTSIYPDSGQVGRARVHEEVEAEQALLLRSRDYFQARLIPVTKIKSGESGLTVWFHSAAGLSVYASAAPAPGLGLPDPKDHYAAALAAAAAAADAKLVAASANLENKSQNWSYRFISASSKEFIDVITDFLGNAALLGRRPARDIMVHPIDIEKAVSLKAAYDAAKSASFTPVWVNLDRDFHGRVLYRFSSADGKTQVRIDATTGKIAD